MFDVKKIVRPSIARLVPYKSARDDFKGEARVLLDANENSFRENLNRYPDPYQVKLKESIAKIKQVPTSTIFLGNGSDEPIDLLMRAFCEPGQDKIALLTPTYGMYAVCAGVNNIEVVEVPLDDEFQIELDRTREIVSSPDIKLLFACSPNNPTGNLLRADDIISLANSFHGLVIVDEAYIDFAESPGLLPQLSASNNLVVLQTLSKAWGLAGIRLGMAFAQPAIIELLNRIKMPYNVNSLTQETALKSLNDPESFQNDVEQIKLGRKDLEDRLSQLAMVKRIYPSDANFLLVQFDDPQAVYGKLRDKGIIVRDRSALVPGCLRITVGTPAQNDELINELKRFSDETDSIY